MSYQPVIIVGAPRSGTNMLRDVLCSIEGIDTWPCDEINYIWRHDNVRWPSDEIPKDRATKRAVRYIRTCFDAQAREAGCEVLVEKTCANSLRVPFVDEVVPEAKYIFIVRDGIDATGSAKLRWRAPLDIPYIMKKVRYVPKLDLPYYALRYLGARLHRLISKEGRLGFWGPALDDMPRILKEHTLDEVCAIQWQRCVDSSASALDGIPQERKCFLRYEDFVVNPEEGLSSVLEFLGRHANADAVADAVSSVSSRSVGLGRENLGEEKVAQLERLVRPTLEKYGYV